MRGQPLIFVRDILDRLQPSDLMVLNFLEAQDAGNPIYEYEGLPLIIAKPTRFTLTESYSEGQFDPELNNAGDADITRSASKFEFKLSQLADVKLNLLNEDKEVVKTFISDVRLPPNESYVFGVSYGQVQPYILPRSGVDFYLELVAKTTDTEGLKVEHKMLFEGDLTVEMKGRGLGQVLHHDVLIHHGNLSLRREDLKLNGRGPELNFIRSYSNLSSIGQFSQTPVRTCSPLFSRRTAPQYMSRGWSHNHDVQMNIIDYTIGSGLELPYNLPHWFQHVSTSVVGGSPIFVRKDSLPIYFPTPRMISVSNGGLFKLKGGQWYPQRGFHGRLSFSDEGVVFRSKDGTDYSFESPPRNANGYQLRPGVLNETKDRNGNILSYDYDETECGPRVKTVTDASGRTLDFEYEDTTGVYSLLTKVNGPDGIALEFTYEEQTGAFPDPLNKQLVAFKRGEFNELYDYEAQPLNDDFNLTKTTDPLGNSTKYFYRSPGDGFMGLQQIHLSFIPRADMVRAVEYPDGIVADFTYSPESNERTVEDLNQNVISYDLNNYGNPRKMSEPLGKITEYVWSIDVGKPDNLMESMLDPEGNLTKYGYDSMGNIAIETDALGKTTVSEWDQDFAVLSSRTDKNGNTTSYEVNSSNGNVESVTDAEGNTTNYSYNSTGERTSITYPKGNSVNYQYDGVGIVKKMTGGEGSTTNYANDVRGRRTSMTDANGNAYSFNYDGLDRLVRKAESDGSYTYSYDAKGNKLSETDKRGLKISYSYDQRDRVEAKSRSFGGGGQSFSYDGNSNLLTETDWKGQTTSHGYNSINQRTSTTNRHGDTATFGYNLVGSKTSETDFEGRTTSYVYDDVYRLERITNAMGDNMSYGYDDLENILSETDYEGRVTTFEYDKRYLRTKRTNALNGQFIWKYDGNGNLESTTDEENNITSFSYDRQDRKFSETDAEGNTSTISNYDGNGNVLTMKDKRGLNWSYGYDALNRKIKIVDPDGFSEIYSFDPNGNQKSTSDKNGNTTSWTYDLLNRVTLQTNAVGAINKYTVYDANNNLVSHTDPLGTKAIFEYDKLDRQVLVTQIDNKGNGGSRKMSYAYDKVGNKTQESDYKGNVSNFKYDALNRLEQTTDPLSQTMSYTYDKVGNQTTSVNKRGYATATVFDNLNRPELITDALSQSISMIYDGVGNVVSETDKRGTATAHTYDNVYRLKTSVKSGVTLLKNTYDGNGNVLTVADANNNITTNEYNGRNLNTKLTFADGTTKVTVYDKVGNPLTVTDEAGQISTFEYDAINRQTSATNAAGEKNKFTYDANNSRTKAIKPKGNSRDFSYDGFNRLEKVTDAAGNITSYAYDTNNNQTLFTDGNGNQVSYVYDNLNRRSEHIQPGSLTTSYVYDAENNIEQITDPKGQIFGFTFDPLNREINRVIPSNNNTDIQFISTGYDANNNIISINETKLSGSESTSMAYDLLDRKTQVIQRGYTIDYTYDDNGNRTSVSSAGGSTTYTFDNRNRLKTAIDPGAGTTTYNYFADGKLKNTLHANGTSVTYDYDAADRAATVTNLNNATIISKFDYQYDINGNRTEQFETQNGFTDTKIATTGYTYDGADRMTGYTIEEGSLTTNYTYTFDRNYNRLTEIVTQSDGSSESVLENKAYSYNAVNWLDNVIDSVTGKNVDYVYDSNGNSLEKTVTEGTVITHTAFAYDARNFLKNVTSGGVGSEVGQGEYDYNYAGMRIRHKNSERGNIDYIYDDKSVLEERSLDDQSLFAHYRYADRLLSLSTGSDTQFYHYSAHRTTTNLSDASGNVQVSYRTNPWGEITQQEGSSANRQVFTGQEHDEKTGLIYFGARYYDPDSARFITQDSYLGEVGTPPSLHRYLYANGNPGYYVDPDGHASINQIDDELVAAITDFQERGWGRDRTALGKVGEIHLEKILKKSGHLIIKGPVSNPGAHNADLIAYDPDTKQLTFIDNKVQTKQGSVSKSPNLDTEAGRLKSITVAKKNLDLMNIPDDQLSDIRKQLNAIQRNPMKKGNWIVTSSLPENLEKNGKVVSNMVRRISERMVNSGVKFAETDEHGKLKIKSSRGSRVGARILKAVPIAGAAVTGVDAATRLDSAYEEDLYHQQFMNELGVTNFDTRFESTQREATIISGEIAGGEGGGWGGAAAGLYCGPWAVVCSPIAAIGGGLAGDSLGGWAAEMSFDSSVERDDNEASVVRKSIRDQVSKEVPKLTAEDDGGLQ